jgi:enoyl-[acyl-carrier-protein] reductase (NADH)
MAPYEGKRGLVLGVANRRSIAWAIAKRLADGGAQLAFTYQGERIEKTVRELADSVSSPLVTECDVRSDDGIARVFDEVGSAFGGSSTSSSTRSRSLRRRTWRAASRTRRATASGSRST